MMPTTGMRIENALCIQVYQGYAGLTTIRRRPCGVRNEVATAPRTGLELGAAYLCPRSQSVKWKYL
jgi:hypothetical protein